jgi:hypothetical protein
MRSVHLTNVLAFLFAGLCLCAADETFTSSGIAKMSRDAEIRQKIPGTWISGGITFTNDLGALSETEMLTFTTNACYSATQTTISAGKTRVKKCQGLWSVHDRILIYSITNCIGVSMTNCTGPEASEPFFYPRAKVVSVNEKQLVLLEWMDQIAFFDRDFATRPHETQTPPLSRAHF